MSWHSGRMAAFDLETSGVDVEQDRIVTAAIVLVGGDQFTETHQWLADPGIEIPADVSKIHGITTERAKAEGRPAREVIEQVSALLAEQVTAGIPIVAMNARYDLTLLDRELSRHGLPALAWQAGRAPLVLDPYVLDKRADQYRKGSRKLTDMAAHYKVPLGDDAHTAGADALAAARIVYRIGVLYPNLRDWPLQRLHDSQVEWAAQQAESLQEYLRKKDPTAVVPGEWPMIPRQQAAS